MLAVGETMVDIEDKLHIIKDAEDELEPIEGTDS